MMYTKGPWIRNGMAIESTEGEAIALVAYKHSKEEFEANASLIAAAPELLEILEQVMKCRIQATPELIHKMRDTLQKAKGD